MIAVVHKLENFEPELNKPEFIKPELKSHRKGIVNNGGFDEV
jgi:hypothetical protein